MKALLGGLLWVVLVFSVYPVHCSERCIDSWTSNDKFLHCGLMSMGGVFLGAVRMPRGYAYGAGLFVTGMKELGDSQDKGNHFCWKDMAWGMAGFAWGFEGTRLAITVDRKYRGVDLSIPF